MAKLKSILGDRLLIQRLPETPELIVAPSGVDAQETPFRSRVIAVGRVSEAIQPGDTVICGAPVGQDRIGSRLVEYAGQPCELISTLDVLAIL